MPVSEASTEKDTKLNDDTTKKVGKFDPANPPKGWTVTELGYKQGYQITHDGINEDGTVSAGCTFKVDSLDDVEELVKHRGRIPVGEPGNPHPEK